MDSEREPLPPGASPGFRRGADGFRRREAYASRRILRLSKADARWTRFHAALGFPPILALALALAAAVGGLAVWGFLEMRDDASATGDPVAGEPDLLAPESGLPMVPVPLPLSPPGSETAATLPSEAAGPVAPPAHEVPAAQGEPVLAAPSPVEPAPPPVPHRSKAETLIFEASPAAEESAGSDAAAEQPRGPEIIGARSRQPVSAPGLPQQRAALTAGTVLPAVLETVVDTGTPGSVRAVVSSEVRTSDGSRVLVPRLSRLEGQYRAGKDRGRKRAMIVWTRLVRPDGTSKRIGAAGSDRRGFEEQFAAASLVSVVSGGTGGDIRVRPGEPIRVTTARTIAVDGVSR